MKYEMRVSKRVVSHPMNDDVIQNGISADVLTVSFDSEWHGVTDCRAVFTNLDTTITVPFSGAETVEIPIPWEVLRYPGWLQVGFIGLPSESKRITTRLLDRPIKVAQSCHVTGPESEPTVDVISDLLARASKALADATAALEKADAADRDIRAAEAARVKAETSRAAAESSRSDAEARRAGAEAERARAESARATSEEERAAAEALRRSAETQRVNSEAERVKSFGESIARAIEATEVAMSAADGATSAGDEASKAAARASKAASEAFVRANAAEAAASKAELASRLVRPYFIQESAPHRSELVDGSMWVQTQGSSVKSINKWNESLPGGGLFPGSETYPGKESQPGPGGDFEKYSV